MQCIYISEIFAGYELKDRFGKKNAQQSAWRKNSANDPFTRSRKSGTRHNSKDHHLPVCTVTLLSLAMFH